MRTSSEINVTGIFVLVLLLTLLVAVIVQTIIIAMGDRGHRSSLRLAEAANRIARESVNSQLRQIHTLVNSDMTAARQGELNQTLVTIIVMKRLRAVNLAAGLSVAEDDLIISNTEMRAEELRGVLADRRTQQLADERRQIDEMQRHGLAPLDLDAVA